MMPDPLAVLARITVVLAVLGMLAYGTWADVELNALHEAIDSGEPFVHNGRAFVACPISTGQEGE